MAIRSTTHILKNTQTNNKALPASGIQMGEPLVNLFNGILFFSGVTNGNYTPFVDPLNATSGGTYFEVGSNVYNLQIRNRITSYNGSAGSLLDGKYLKGTANGFVLEDITSIGSITGFTYVPSTNVLTIFQSNGTDLPVTLSAFTGINLYGSNNVNGNLTVTGTTTLQGTSTYNIVANGSNPLEIVNFSSLTGYVETNDTYVTGGTVTTPANNSSKTVTVGLNYKRPDGNNYTLTTENTFVTGGTYSNGTISFSYNDGVKPGFDVTGIDGTDTYVTGGTSTGSSDNSADATISLTYNQGVSPSLYSLNYKDTYVTGGTYAAGTITLTRNDGTQLPISGITSTDTFVTGFTYDNASNKITLSQNQGQADKNIFIDVVSGLTVSNLTTGQVVYAGVGGQLKTESNDFGYNESNNTLTIGSANGGNLIVNNPSGTTATFGQGGVIIGSGGSYTTPGLGDLTVHGNLTVFGSATTVSTGELYIEDPTITLNYNPSGSSTVTSIGSGIVIQDGSGVQGTNTTLQIGQLFGNTNILSNSEYLIANEPSNKNRGFYTQLNDIVIRNTNNNSGAPDGYRVLAEGDILDGGTW
jgi:hypothetical protein